MVKSFLGTLFLVVGNSGSGKDSIISGIIENYPSSLKKIYAPKRYITRSPSKFEKNISLSTEEFRELEKKGKFALTWHIYGLDYGISKDIEDYLKKGHPVIINVSRTVIYKAREKYENVKVVFIEVPFEITYQRIKDRKRESEDFLKERIERARNNPKFPEADYIIDNSGKLDSAIDQFIKYIISVIKEKEKDN
ncbi:MAG: phosphonate metabolism protein/1,5-bisphosphokinase (PRPP-forming) PhnN [Candidatus Hermodarchaeota archaeon]